MGCLCMNRKKEEGYYGFVTGTNLYFHIVQGEIGSREERSTKNIKEGRKNTKTQERIIKCQ